MTALSSLYGIHTFTDTCEGGGQNENYPITGYIEVEGRHVPALDVPQISDDRWQQEARFSAESRFWDAHGFAPRDTAQALQWQADRSAELEKKFAGCVTELDEDGRMKR